MSKDQVDLAHHLVDDFSRWVQQADVKAALLSGALGVLLAGTAAAQRQVWLSLHPRGSLGGWLLISLAVLALGILATIWALGRVLFPFTRESDRVSNPPQPNHFFYGWVASVADAPSFSQSLLSLATPEDDCAREAWDLARVFDRKSRRLKWAMALLGGTGITFLLWLALATIASPQPQ
jgi:hypothetical protein